MCRIKCKFTSHVCVQIFRTLIFDVERKVIFPLNKFTLRNINYNEFHGSRLYNIRGNKATLRQRYIFSNWVRNVERIARTPLFCRATMLISFKFSHKTESSMKYFCDIARPDIHDVTRVREFNSSCYRMRSLFMHLPPDAARFYPHIASF